MEQVGQPIKFVWNKCKLETIYGHGITTTPLQADQFMPDSKWWI